MARPPIICKETITRAINALLKWIQSQSKSKSTTTSDLSIYLILGLKKIPHCGRSLSFSIPIPHPIHSPIFLIFDDRPNSPLPYPSIQSLSLPPISIVPFSEIQSHGQIPTGLLFVDRRINKLLPKKKNKDVGGGRTEVVELDLSKNRWAEEVRRRVGSTVLNFRGGTCCGIKVGMAGMAREEIMENVAAAAVGVVEKVPRKWASVRALHVKAAESLALPIYEAVDGEMKRKGEGLEGGEAAKRSKVCV